MHTRPATWPIGQFVAVPTTVFVCRLHSHAQWQAPPPRPPPHNKPLLDVPYLLLCDIVSLQCCGAKTAANVALTSRDMRQAVLSSVRECRILSGKNLSKPDTAGTALDFAINSLPAVRCLRLRGMCGFGVACTMLSGIQMAALGELAALQHLQISRYRLGEGGAVTVASLGALTCLKLIRNSIGDEGACMLTRLTALKRLHVAGHDDLGEFVGNEGARALASLTGLTCLQLTLGMVGDAGAEALSSSLTALQHLDLSGNCISDASPLCALTALTD